MADVAKTVQFKLTAIAALSATWCFSAPVKAQISPSSEIISDMITDMITEAPAGIEEKTQEQILLPTSPNSPTTPTSQSPLAQFPPSLNPDGNRPIPSLPPPQDLLPPSDTPPPAPPPQTIPPPVELLEPSSPTPTIPNPATEAIEDTITVQKFEFKGNTAFSEAELAQATANFVGRPITFAELLNARTAVTQLYTSNGYVTSGAFIPPQSLTDGTITIEIIEGGVQEIQVEGLRRLHPGYVRERIGLVARAPLNVPRLLEGLRLLQLDPLIKNVSAELSTGSGPGESIVIVTITEANTWSYQLTANNGRSPSVGSFRRGASLTQANLLGLGDRLTLGYTNTDASDEINATYTLPINPRNGTLSFSYSDTSSQVIEQPFSLLDIESSATNFELTYRQPLVQTATQEFALGLTATKRNSQTLFLEDLIGEAVGFPSPGADQEGRIRVSALRFFQEWTQRGAKEVFALRSQFNFGLDIFNATTNDDQPDSRFFSWRGQAQWVRLLAPDTLLLIRGDMQLADQQLLPIEQFGLGGQRSVRGYRQDVLLTDNGAFASAEVRLPILRIPKWDGVLQLTPFLDWGITWNNGNAEDPDPSNLAAIGLGLQWQQGERITARLDWGIPLISVPSTERTWQENGLYFSIIINPF